MDRKSQSVAETLFRSSRPFTAPWGAKSPSPDRRQGSPRLASEWRGPFASGTRSRSMITIDDQWRLGCARAADRAALAKHVGIVEAATVPLCVHGGGLLELERYGIPDRHASLSIPKLRPSRRLPRFATKGQTRRDAATYWRGGRTIYQRKTRSEAMRADTLRLRRPVLYPTELRAHIGVTVSVAGLSALPRLHRGKQTVALSADALPQDCHGLGRRVSWTLVNPRSSR